MTRKPEIRGGTDAPEPANDGCSADIAGLEREFGRAPMKLPTGRVATRDQMGSETGEPLT